jgi:hypothetical protein
MSTTGERNGGGEQADLPRPWAAILAVVGAVCGLAAHIAIRQAGPIGWQLGPAIAFVVGGLAFCLAVDPRRWVPAALASLGLALLLGLLATTAALRFGSPADAGQASLGFSLVIEALIVAQISVPFLQTWQEQGRAVFPYDRLFAHAWNNSLTVALSVAFAGLFWLILWLFATLFSMVGLGILERLIEKPGFAWPATAAIVAVGISAARNFRRIVVALRRIVFSLFSVLTPLYAVLSISFLVALVLGGFEKLAAVGSASAILVALLVIGIVLLNAIRATAARMPRHRGCSISAPFSWGLPCSVSAASLPTRSSCGSTSMA